MVLCIPAIPPSSLKQFQFKCLLRNPSFLTFERGGFLLFWKVYSKGFWWHFARKIPRKIGNPFQLGISCPIGYSFRIFFGFRRNQHLSKGLQKLQKYKRNVFALEIGPILNSPWTRCLLCPTNVFVAFRETVFPTFCPL